MNELSDRIHRLRCEMKLTQQALGRLAGVSKSAVSQWERGITEPQRDALLSLRKNAGINPEWLMHGIGSMRVDGAVPSDCTDNACRLPSDPTLTPEEWEVLSCYRVAPPRGKAVIRAVAKFAAEAEAEAEAEPIPRTTAPEEQPEPG